MRRRSFIKAAGVLAFGFEEVALAAQEQGGAPATAEASPAKPMPMGQICDVKISRLICGGNLISGFAHSRDLIYVSPLLKRYFTDDKVMETFQIAEAQGINMAILRLDKDTLRIVNRYWKEKRGNLQWIAQIKPQQSDLKGDVRRAVDAGAQGVYIQGESGDQLYKMGRIDIVGEVIENIRSSGVISGVGAHNLQAIKACEEAKIPCDFYMKTFNSKSYWSAGPKERHDSVWEETPLETLEFMKTVEKSWIAFKVLGAGAIEPREGFKYAFENGADFVCVGMFDFQIEEDASIARELLAGKLDRKRAWKS
jgi:hypothetical protein